MLPKVFVVKAVPRPLLIALPQLGKGVVLHPVKRHLRVVGGVSAAQNKAFQLGGGWPFPMRTNASKVPSPE